MASVAGRVTALLPGPADAPTDEQAAAIAHGTGPCLVVAAPGSGKTFVLTRRFLRLVAEGADPASILLLTYNRRAAEELQQRLEEQLGPVGDEPVATTYHGFAQGLVRRFAPLLGWPETIRIASDAERWLLLAEALASVRPRGLWNPARPYDAVDEVRRHIERCKQELVTPDRYLATAEHHLAQATDPEERLRWRRSCDLACVYGVLQERYRNAGIVDHDDTIALAAELLETASEVRSACAGITTVMVDEYQDTNSAQARMVELLVAPHRNLMVVADDDQAIYRFRGASRLNIDRFREHFAEARELPLLVNRRSTPEIVAVAAAVIAPAAGRVAKAVVAHRAGGDPVRVVRAEHTDDEATAVVDAVERRLGDGARPSQVAVLASLRAALEPIARRLEAAGIAYVSSGGRDFFKAPEVKTAMALLEAVADPTEVQAVLRCCELPAFRIAGAARARLCRELTGGEPLAARLRRPDAVDGLADADTDRLRRLVAMLTELHAMAGGADAREVVSEAFVRSDFAALGELPREVERRQFAANVSRLYELVEEFEAVRPGASFREALEYLRLAREAGAEGAAPLGGDVEGVVLSTIHGSKGLEWQHVIVVDAVDGVIPRTYRGEAAPLSPELVGGASDGAAGHLEEQRRLFYVALTRARDSLTVSWAPATRTSYRSRVRTPFLAPVPARLLELVDQPYTPQPVPRRRPLPALRDEGETLTLSWSLVQAFRDCPKRFEYLRLWEIPQLHALDAWYGTVLHAALARLMTARREGRTPDRAGVERAWVAAWEGAETPPAGAGPLRAEGLERLLEYVASPLMTPSGEVGRWVEHPVELVVEPTHGHAVVGRVDRLDLDPDGVPTVVDYKTGRPNPEAAARSLQLKVYALAAAREFGAPVVRGAIHHLQTATAATAEWSREELERAAYGLSMTFAEIERGHAECRFPARPTPWACSGCPVRIVCSERAEPG